MNGSIVVVGIGPGDLALLTPAARQAIETADVILGYRTYLELIGTLAPDVGREASGMRQEVERVQRAIALAKQGNRVALVSGGDPGIYGMSGLVYEVLQRQDEKVAVEVIPGISALNAAASLLGAPLMTDFATISLSDQLVPCEDIVRRVELAAQADFVLCLYNPKGLRRVEPFRLACEALARHRRPETPVGIVRSAYRPDQRVEISRLVDLPSADVDMLTVIIVGNSQTEVYGGKLVTPRGYAGKYSLAGRETGDDASA
jgi:precorrin-3B C17-methyltransferase